MLFTFFAYVCIRRRAVKAHREWMIRSYAIVLIFLEGRVLMAVPALARHGMDAVVLVNWGCLAVTLVVVESFLRWREVFPAGQAPAHSDTVNRRLVGATSRGHSN
jgi:hypothetical protein